MAMDGNGGGYKDDESTMSKDDVFPANLAEIVASLPQGPHCPMFPGLRLYRGFWVPDGAVLMLPKLHSFEKRPGSVDILLASFPKSGTTWLKALGFATVRRPVHSPFDAGHPLLHFNSHDCVKYMEFLEDDGDMNMAPRLLAAHLPYSLLPRCVTADGSGCRIVYITRDPKDTLVSTWHFRSNNNNDNLVQPEAAAVQGAQPAQPPAAAASSSFEEAFDLFCRGQVGLGPQWEHAREYWEASKRRPGHVLCLRYEEMLQDPVGNLKKMAEFMGCPFSAAEEEAGVVRAIVELCSMGKQRDVPVNKTGAIVSKGKGCLQTIQNKHYFRKGMAGDWRNHMTPEMAARLDGVVEDALKGSGFTFGNTYTPNNTN